MVAFQLAKKKQQSTALPKVQKLKLPNLVQGANGTPS